MQESMPAAAAEAPMRDLGQGSASPATARADADPLADPRALQILSTEHWSLLATRSLAYNEAFTRTGMFLTFLSATLIVIGFLIGAQGLSASILPIAIVLLFADLFIGAATVGRLLDASAEELQTVRGMNRIRHAYRDMVPGLEPYFVSGFHDDAVGVLATYAARTAGSPLGNIVHGLTTMVGMVAIIDSMVFAALCGLIAAGIAPALGPALLAATVGFAIAFLAFLRIGSKAAIEGQRNAESRFPTPVDPVD